jgi:hypothetical protein
MRGSMGGGVRAYRELFESILRSIYCGPRLALKVARQNWVPRANPLRGSRIRG